MFFGGKEHIFAGSALYLTVYKCRYFGGGHGIFDVVAAFYIVGGKEEGRVCLATHCEVFAKVAKCADAIVYDAPFLGFFLPVGSGSKQFGLQVSLAIKVLHRKIVTSVFFYTVPADV